MKAMLLRLGALSVACAPLVAPGPASAQAGDPVPEIVDFCQQLIEIRPETTIGRCLASLIAAGPALDTHVCLFWETNDLLDDFGFSNVGECVKSGIAAP
jgi:hypothetical protein